MAFKKAINSPIFSEISNYCSNNNIECYVVGGFVRDFFLNRESKDVDILIIGDGISAAKKIANTIDPNIFLLQCLKTLEQHILSIKNMK